MSGERGTAVGGTSGAAADADGRGIPGAAMDADETGVATADRGVATAGHGADAVHAGADGVHPGVVRAIATVDELWLLLADCADAWDMPDRSGDPVDILDHDRQCAELLRASFPADAELQVAGLVHDIGHVLVPGDDEGHGRHGAAAVRGLLGDRVARLVELHVTAKRYLAAADPVHAAALSASSLRTLVAQGGPMTAAERLVFESDPDFDAALALRRADDAGKVVGLTVRPLGAWRELVERVAAAAA
ncbi:HD domain-containing protein [Nocardia sp. NPDC003693]